MASIINALPSDTHSTGAMVPKSFASSKRWLSSQFYQALNRHTENDDGDRVTFAQKMIEGIVSMAVDEERDDYVRLAASKFIIEHMEGKAGSMQEETHEEMPQIVINVKNMNMNSIQSSVENLASSVPKSDIVDEMEVDYEVNDVESD